jgi:hypothetical protein
MKKGIFVIAAAALVLVACKEESGLGPGPTYPQPTTPATCLTCVEVSFNQRDVNLLQAMLSEDFVFYFDPDDIGHHPPGSQYVIPESWSYTEFWQAAQRMFDRAHRISLRISTEGIGEPAPGQTTYRAENVTISILVMIDELNGYIADQGYCNFAFERYEGAEGKKLWRLTKWWDNTAVYYDANPGISPTSLGRVLALYY